MAESIREAEVREDWLFAARIKALKRESQGGFGLKHGHSIVSLAISKRRQEGERPCRCRGSKFGNFGTTCLQVVQTGSSGDPAVGRETP
jgi:hypothetical protein